MKSAENIVIKLTVNNHAGVMSHITGLFSRRGYNLEGILCGKIANSERSRMYLLVEKSAKMEQTVRQLQKLYDVIDLSVEDGENNPIVAFIEQQTCVS
jgi:acetolactate synthase I/III small subunit